MKRFAAFTIAALIAVASGTAVFAEYDPSKVIEENAIATKGVSELADNGIFIDGERLDGAELVSSEGFVMFPVRTVAEKLGYTVEWKSEEKAVTLTKLPHYITFSIGVDGYTFARTAPMPLGKAAEIIDGTAYAPVEMLSEIMLLSCEVSENSVNINAAVQSAEVDIISTDTEANSILVNDSERGEVILMCGDILPITNSSGSAVEIGDLNAGDKLHVEYGAAMTMSIPPINNPISVVLKN